MENSGTESESQAIPPVVENAGLEDVAAGVEATIGENLRLAPEGSEAASPADPAPADPAPAVDAADGAPWRREPIANFRLDWRGRVKLRRDGSPVRRAGAPAKPKAGDLLADGTTFDAPDTKVMPDAIAGRVVDPAGQQDHTAGGGESSEGDGPRCAQTGPEFGRILADWGFSWAESIAGADAKPTAPERKMIGDAASAAFENRRVPWVLLLVVAGAVYAVRVWTCKMRKRDDDGRKPDAHLHRGTDEKRQNATSQEIGGAAGFFTRSGL